MEKERLTWDEIVAKYPDKWVGLGEVEWKDEEHASVRSAVVLGVDNTDSFWERRFAGEDIHSLYTTPDNPAPFSILAGVWCNSLLCI